MDAIALREMHKRFMEQVVSSLSFPDACALLASGDEMVLDPQSIGCTEDVGLSVHAMQEFSDSAAREVELMCVLYEGVAQVTGFAYILSDGKSKLDPETRIERR